MARINIEDSLFKDARWWDLIIKVGCQYKGLGYLTKAWILAQEHWLEYESVPAKAWPDELNILIEVQLAIKNTDGSVYVKGSKKAFCWLEQRADAGRKGGLKKRSLSGRLADGSKRKQTEANPSKPKPPSLTLTLTPSLSPSSDSISISSSKNEECTEPDFSKSAPMPASPISELDSPELKETLVSVTPSAQRAWLNAYGDPAWIKQEILRAIAWMEVNPKKKSKHMGRFLGSWLSRGWEQHRKTIASQPVRKSIKQILDFSEKEENE